MGEASDSLEKEPSGLGAAGQEGELTGAKGGASERERRPSCKETRQPRSDACLRLAGDAHQPAREKKRFVAVVQRPLRMRDTMPCSVSGLCKRGRPWWPDSAEGPDPAPAATCIVHSLVRQHVAVFRVRQAWLLWATPGAGRRSCSRLGGPQHQPGPGRWSRPAQRDTWSETVNTTMRRTVSIWASWRAN
jgi:hypothetical protein